MNPKRALAFVEGHGEVAAAANLLTRLSQDLSLPLTWVGTVRWSNLHQERGVQKALEYVRRRADVEACLLLRDEDDDCPRERAPSQAALIAREKPSVPIALVLLHPEFEVLFLPCVRLMAGRPLGSGAAARPGLREGSDYSSGWEDRRDVKGVLSSMFPPGRIYKPTLDQLFLTQMIDFPTLRASGLPCFGSLERALRFLAAAPSGVYPPPLRLSSES